MRDTIAQAIFYAVVGASAVIVALDLFVWRP